MRECTDEELRTRIKAYLKDTGKTQQDLADFLGVSLQAVRSQMSKARVSARTRFAMIPILEKHDKGEIETPESTSAIEGEVKNGIIPIALAFDSEEWNTILEASKKQGLSANAWLQKIIMEDAKQITKEDNEI